MVDVAAVLLFRAWLASQPLSRETVATLLGCSRQTIWGLTQGRFAPSLRLAIKVAEVTGGAVPVGAWRPRHRRRAA